MKVYKVRMEQWTRAGYLFANDTASFAARSMVQAAVKAISYARREKGYLKSQPIDILSIEQIVSDLR